MVFIFKPLVHSADVNAVCTRGTPWSSQQTAAEISKEARLSRELIFLRNLKIPPLINVDLQRFSLENAFCLIENPVVYVSPLFSGHSNGASTRLGEDL
jgi:hypothetical protein